MPEPESASSVSPYEPGPKPGTGCAIAALGVVVGLGIAWYWRAVVGVPIAVVAAFLVYRLFRSFSARNDEYAASRRARFEAIAAPAGDAWRKLLLADEMPEWVAAAEPHIRPAVRLATAPARQVPVGRSRIGGTPDLPAGMVWPKRKKGSLPFLAQLDLEEIATHLPTGFLPASGYLWFFYDTTGWSGGEYDPKKGEGPIVFYEPGRPALRPATMPDDVNKTYRFPPCALSVVGYGDLPDISAVPELSRLFDEDEDKGDRYYVIEAYVAGDTMGNVHKLLGWASSIQDSMEVQCQEMGTGVKSNAKTHQKDLEAAVREWRLLLQVESDKNAGMLWGDAGRLYFWIREDDLRAVRFDQTLMIMQCY
jgi:uncharacterized protein YwqG